MRQFLSLVLVLGLASAACAGEKSKAAPHSKNSHAPSKCCTGPCLPTTASFDYQLRHLRADDAARQLGEAIAVTGDRRLNASPIVIVAESQSNRLNLTVPAACEDEIGEMIAKIDVEPKQFHVRLKLTQTDEHGKVTTTISPQLITLNGQTATVAVNDADNGTTAIEIEVTEAAAPEAEALAAEGRARVWSTPTAQYRTHLPCPPMSKSPALGNVWYGRFFTEAGKSKAAKSGRRAHESASGQCSRCESAAEQCESCPAECDACPAECDSSAAECDSCPADEEHEAHAGQCESWPDPHQAARGVKPPSILYLGKDILNFNRAFQPADEHRDLDEEIEAALKQAERDERSVRLWPAAPQPMVPPQPSEAPKLVYPLFKNVGGGIGAPVPPASLDEHASQSSATSECTGARCASSDEDATPLPNETIAAASEPDALTTSVYPVADVIYLLSGGSFGTKGVDNVAPAIASCKNLIQRSVRPQSWERNGGQASIEFMDATMSLVIRQTSEGHKQVKEKLKLLRRLAESETVDEEPAAEEPW